MSSLQTLSFVSLFNLLDLDKQQEVYSMIKSNISKKYYIKDGYLVVQDGKDTFEYHINTSINKTSNFDIFDTTCFSINSTTHLFTKKNDQILEYYISELDIVNNKIFKWRIRILLTENDYYGIIAMIHKYIISL